MSYNIKSDKEELYKLEFLEKDNQKLARKIIGIVRRYKYIDLMEIAEMYGKYDDDEYNTISAKEYLIETARFYINEQ